MRLIYFWLLLLMLAAGMPLVTQRGSLSKANVHFSGWPQQFAGNELYPIPLTENEERFSRDFSGKLAKFTDGSREIVMRWLDTPSRSLHPAGDCLKGSGYTVKPRPVLVDRDGIRWGCISAMRRGVNLQVCERIYDEHGNSWTDTSSWFWAAMLGKTTGPWRAMTIASELHETGLR